MRTAPVTRILSGITLILIATLVAGTAFAVDPGKTSYTADAVCAFRSIAALDPDPKTRNPDYMAKLFLNPALMTRFPGLGLAHEDAKIAMDRLDHGVVYWVNARTHHLDAKLTAALKAGIHQVVIMGAGFDSRAYRFHADYPRVQFFEVDLPATSSEKKRRVARILGKRPEWVTYVPIDFNTQTLGEVLGDAGFSKEEKTFYLWEGVTYYVAKAGVESTFRHIADHSAPGSQIVFDYMIDDVVLGRDYSAYGARRVVHFISNRGEPYIFGIEPQHLETYINQFGLSLRSDIDHTVMTRRYLMKSDGSLSGRMSEFLRIVHADIPEMPVRKQLIARVKQRDIQAASGNAAADATHRVTVPDGVQALLDGQAHCMRTRDFNTMMTYFSKHYRYNGGTRESAQAFIRFVMGKRPIDQFDYVLTRFDQTGDRAKIDGFVQRNGFRTPLPFGALDIIKEADGHWRWYGNQQ